MKVLLCCILKMENHYLEEWLRHYVNIGVDKIVIFDNNDIDGKYAESIFDLDYVNECKSKNIIDVHPIPGEKQAQTRCYNKCYELYAKDYDWLMFFDIDEFLMLERHKSIKEFLSQPKFDAFEMIHVNWKVYDDNDIISVVNNDYSLVKRFTRVSQGRRSIHSELKSIIRGGMMNVKFVKNPHTCDNRSFKCCNVLGQATSSKAAKTAIVIHKDAWLNHYICKTIEEFCYNKLVRRGGHTLHKKDLRYNLTFFFNYNKRTADKIKYFKENFDQTDVNIKTEYIASPATVVIRGENDSDKPKLVKRAGAATTTPVYTPVIKEKYVQRLKDDYPSPVAKTKSVKQTTVKPVKRVPPDLINVFRNK